MSYSTDRNWYFLQQILKLLPSYISKYPKKDQFYLNEFLNILKQVNINTSKARDILRKTMLNYSNYYVSKNEYLEIPFLWFTVDYFNSSSRLLRVSKFEGEYFLRYFVEHLRRSPSGVFPLIKNRTPLKSHLWEKTQKECLKLIDPLTNEELIILKVIFSIVSELKFSNLTLQKLKTNLSKLIDTKNFIRDIIPLLIKLDSSWNLRYFPKAFGIESFLFYIDLKGLKSFKEIFDISDPLNTTLCMSDIFTVRNNEKKFHGIFYVPFDYVSEFLNFIYEFETKGKIKIETLEQITNFRFSNSLNHYTGGIGWKEYSITYLTPLKNKLESITKGVSRKRENYPSPSYLSQPFSTKWTYKDFEPPLDVIKQFCDIKSRIIIENWDQEFQTIQKSQVDLIDELILQGAAIINYLPNALITEYSTNYYWFNFPKNNIKNLDELFRLLDLSPSSYIFQTKQNFHLWISLTPNIGQWLSTELDSNINSIERKFQLMSRRIEWYDPKRSWKVPKCFETT